MINQKIPLVSVCMITYNHADFIGQAIESVFSQSTDFEFELVIGEDCSSDNTAEIISTYLLKYPKNLKVRYNQTNLGMLPNFRKTLEECRGKYIALLEGDDYWIDPLKLQKQISFLENNPSFSMCFHPTQVLEDGKFSNDRFTRSVPDVTDITDLAKGNYMHTCSVVYRARLLKSFPDSFNTSTVGDYFLHMLNAQYGPIKKLPDLMAVYRVHAGGVWSSHNGMDEKILKYLECMIGCFSPEINQLLIKRHNTISTCSFLRNINAPDREASFKRCLMYGNAYFLEQLELIVKENKKMHTGIFNQLKKFPLFKLEQTTTR